PLLHTQRIRQVVNQGPARGQPGEGSQKELEADNNKDKRKIEIRKRDLLLQSYRAVRLNLEDEGMFPEAGELYVREMDLKRDYRVGGRSYRFLLWLYKLASKYGESWLRPLVWLGVIVGISTAIFTSTGVNDGTRDIHYQFKLSWDFWMDWENWWPFVCALKSTIPGLGMMEPRPVGPWGALGSIFTTATGVILITLLALAIRRRFRR
ncbi:MAG: hypothetical protein ACP5QG_04225, partial [candidate division WOR-3 bacterium]